MRRHDNAGKRHLFARAEVGATLSDAAFRAAKGPLRLDLVELQQRNRLEASFPIVVLLAGVRGAGVMDTLNLLNSWMDPRWIHTHATDTPSDEERERPPLWRFWRTLPVAGAMGLYLGGWYGEPFAEFGAGNLARGDFDAAMRRVAAFEQTLANDGALVLKLWLHLDKEAQAKVRHVHKPDPVFGFRSSDADWQEGMDYDSCVKPAHVGIQATQSALAPWHIIEGGDDNFRRIRVLTVLRDALQQHFKKLHEKKKAAAKSLKLAAKIAKKKIKKSKSKTARTGVLAKVDLSRTMSVRDYTRAFVAVQKRLYAAQKEARARGLSTVVMFEGWDAAGKGGAIRRLTYSLNARNYKVVPIAAPNDEERAHHYLWRFWRSLPRAGRMTLFDRSWYGRVLVERVDALIPESAWKRAYDEINDFEAQLTAQGDLVLKFWLHIDRDEQRKRFEDREETPYKRWKITADDWHNRKRWGLYVEAIEEMLARTSRPNAPWHVVAANDKHHARIFVLETVADAMEAALRNRRKPASLS